MIKKFNITILLALAIFCLLTLVFIHEYLSIISKVNHRNVLVDSNEQVKAENDINNPNEFDSLRVQIFLLEQQLLHCSHEMDIAKKKLQTYKAESIKSYTNSKKIIRNEREIYSYSAFTLKNYFPVAKSLYDKNVQKSTDRHQNVLNQVIESSLRILNINTANENRFKTSNFELGFVRSTPEIGYQYDLFFRRNGESKYLRFDQPLEPLRLSSIEFSKKEIINFILPLTGGIRNFNSFRLFLSSFEVVALTQDKRHSTLTIVYSIENKSHMNMSEDVDNIINEFIKRTGFKEIRLFKVNTNAFSRAYSLEYGVNNCCAKDPNKLIFFCDVDVLFTQNFLDLCRFNTRKNQQAFFPILYSYYNPKRYQSLDSRAVLLESIFDKVNSNKSTYFTAADTKKIDLAINNEFGSWRDSGFGMACFYKNDFDNAGGFGEYVNKFVWGGEDKYLVRKFLEINIEIFRAVTPGLFHLFHAKTCDYKAMNESQLNECIKVKVANEAPANELAMLYYKNNKVPLQN